MKSYKKDISLNNQLSNNALQFIINFLHCGYFLIEQMKNTGLGSPYPYIRKYFDVFLFYVINL